MTNSDDSPASLSAIEIIAGRRAARAFDSSRPLGDDVLKRILHLATLAPSGFNLQPWRFVVVRDPRNRRRLRDCAFNRPLVTEAPVVLIVLGYLHPHRSHLDEVIQQAGALGAVTTDQAAELRARAYRTLERLPDRTSWATRSTMLAVATLLLAAEALGVASALIEPFDTDRLRAAFGVPDDHAVCGLIALGHAASTEPFPGRLGLDEVCFQEHFGQPWTLGEPEAEGPGIPALDPDRPAL